jgi:hypothetical protein
MLRERPASCRFSRVTRELGRGRGSSFLRVCRCAQVTTAAIRQHADRDRRGARWQPPPAVAALFIVQALCAGRLPVPSALRGST